jgi:hypothetical protein
VRLIEWWNVRLTRPTTWLAAKMMPLYCALRICDLEMSYWYNSRDANILQAINNSQLPNAAMTRKCGILHIGRAHRAAHQGGPLCRKKESAYLRQGLYIGPATPWRAHSLMHAGTQRACKSRTHTTHRKPKGWRWLVPGFWGMGYRQLCFQWPAGSLIQCEDAFGVRPDIARCQGLPCVY